MNPVRIGPEMPEVPAINTRDIPTTQEGATAPAPAVKQFDVVRAEQPNGIVVETIMAVQGPRPETREQIQARVKTSEKNRFGFTVETY